MSLVVASVFIQVVEQSAGLVLFYIKAGQANQAAGVVAGVDHLGLNLDASAGGILANRHFVDIEAQAVQSLDAAVDLPLLFRVERLSAG